MIDRVESADSGTPDFQLGGGGATPTSTLFRKKYWWVANLDIPTARKLVKKWHYAKGASKTRVYLHGLFPRDYFWNAQAVGAAWWIPPMKSAAVALSKDWQSVLCLSRLVCDDSIPRNAESFLIRHSMGMIDRNRWPVLVTYADEWQGHRGTIYRATGWQECGKTAPEATYQINGRLLCRKAGGHTRTRAEMKELGAVHIGNFSRIRFVHRV